MLPVDSHGDLHLLRKSCNSATQSTAHAAADEPVGRVMQPRDESEVLAGCCLNAEHDAAVDKGVEQRCGESVVHFESELAKHERHLQERRVP